MSPKLSTTLTHDAATRAIIFTGAGRAFCAGDDRREHVQPKDEAEARDLVEAIQRATEAIIFGAKPVVGAINGWAVGGGFEWAINCDFPLWAESAKGFFPEVSLNIFVTGAVTSFLPALVGLLKAREMLFLGERYDAPTLQTLGVAWRVVPDEELQSAAREVAVAARQPPFIGGVGNEAGAQPNRVDRPFPSLATRDRCNRRRIPRPRNHPAAQRLRIGKSSA